MSDVIARRLDGSSTTLPAASIAALRKEFRGPLCLSGEAGYDEARTIWNAMIDRRPALVIRAANAGDVSRAVRLATAEGLVLAVRGGGHNIAGTAICEGGLLLDLAGFASALLLLVTPAHGAIERSVRRVEQRLFQGREDFQRVAPSSFPGPEVCANATTRILFGSVPGLSFN